MSLGRYVHGAGRWHPQRKRDIVRIQWAGSLWFDPQLERDLINMFVSRTLWVFHQDVLVVELLAEKVVGISRVFEATSGFVVRRALPCYTLEKRSLATMTDDFDHQVMHNDSANLTFKTFSGINWKQGNREIGQFETLRCRSGWNPWSFRMVMGCLAFSLRTSWVFGTCWNKDTLHWEVAWGWFSWRGSWKEPYCAPCWGEGWILLMTLIIQ